LIPLLLALLVAGCSSPGQESPQPAPTPSEPVHTLPADPIDALLDEAARSPAPEAARLRLDAATRLVAANELARALDAVAPLAHTRLAPAQAARYAWVLARADLAQGDAARALERLSAPAVRDSAGADRGLLVAIAGTRAEAQLAIGHPMRSAEERAALQPWLVSDAERESNARALLGALGRVPLAQVEEAATGAASEDWRAWLELAAAVRDIGVPAGAQRQRLQQWRARYASLAALDTATRVLLPESLERIASPARVALLLPLSGRTGASGQAVLQGYLAERYADLQASGAEPSVAVIDTAAEPGGFAAAYRRATADGAALVVGPLLKEELALLGRELAVEVPTLALNFLDEDRSTQPGLTLFGIDSGDEVAQLVRDARAGGHERVLVLADAGERARRLADGFQRGWKAASGESLGTLFLADLNDYRASLEQTLLLDQSTARARALEQLLGLPLVAEPRRREDLDLVVLLAEPAAARSIRSLLTYLYAGDLPVWGTSLSRTAAAEQAGNLDLEGLRFLDMPWFAPQEQPLREATARAVPAGPVERLVALGADAARLQARLALLEWLPDAGLAGASGELTRDRGGRLHRQSDWFVVREGAPRAERPRAPSREPALPAGEEPAPGEQAWTQPAATPAGPPSSTP
jgi:hypothetical protein